ncbi:Beta-Ig-H3/fasciclin [Flavobacteria bacterium BAL38]|uniref:fasciclin domain-containing protein n=1 Tax=unclassified Flavobacterium TaxID=196869 RepID=UPI0000F3993A|nr:MULTISPECIES: fasciclin domain-containing protein [unclassified Flavobacterium]EAZ95924.1 Beta-Ig-H3/fasciclin [Flavobacteria bacterium BAL38]MQP52515.1 fasciclin domain-containing protein [Flavobacterium sp. LMO9]MQP62585.1 fasciclin domain-containing protein [Flavobacterium sp. LMO6]
MKNYAKLIKLTLLAVTSTLMFSCSDDDSTSSSISSISDVASKNSDLSILVDALERTDLLDVLDQNGSYTVFAPTNGAFNTFLADNNFSSLDAVPVDALREVLLNHVVVGANLASNLRTGYVKTLGKGSASSTNTLSMFINTSDGVTLNGVSSVIIANIGASNGVIHVVDAVIGLPTIVTHALANPNFSTLVGALTSNGQPDFVGILSGTTNSPFTVFAPSNDSFTAFENQNPGVLGSLTAAQLTSVLSYHVVAGANVLSNAIPSGPITTFETGTFTITGTTITDEAMRQTNIVAVDVQAANGVIHVINNVILPELN